MTPLDAASASALSLGAVAAGATTACVLQVSPGPGEGARMLLVVESDGSHRRYGSLGQPGRDTQAQALATHAISDLRHTDGLVTLDDGAEVYLEIRRPVLDLVIVGAGHIARPMARMGADLGYRVWVLDDRPDFATRERFPDAFQVLRADFSHPFKDVPIHGGTHILLVTRGHKYDYDCLIQVLRMDLEPAYIGMIGSRRRVRATFVQLVEDGIPSERLRHIHAPVGLDIGAETPEEIAVAVAAELVMVRRGGSGASLRDMENVAQRFFTQNQDDG